MAAIGTYPKQAGDYGGALDFNMVYYAGALASSTLTCAAVTVASTATLISSVSTRKGILIRNNGTANIFIGGSGVTTATGKTLPPSKSIYLVTKDSIYGITGGASQNLRYMEVV